MDLKELKEIWKDSFEGDDHLDQKEIEAKLKLKRRSGTALNKIAKSYLFELIMGAIVYAIIIAGIIRFIEMPAAIIFILVVTLLIGVSYVYAWRTYKKIIRTDMSSSRLVTSLSETIKFIEKYVNLSKTTFFKYMIIPIAILFGMFMGIYAVSEDRSVFEVIASLESRSIIKIAVIFVVFSSVMIPLTQYMNKRMYKRHLDELKQCLEDFIDNDHQS
jgi:hypothetical protein